jgi:cardiolipin synthase
VHLETYIFNDDASGQQVARALADAAARGVQVRVVVDGFGTIALTGEVAAIIAASRVEVRVFRPFHTIIGMRLRVLRRLHRKVGLIDAAEAFVGGINILDDRVDPNHGALVAPRFDFAVQVTGPLVHSVGQTLQQVWEQSEPLPTQTVSVPGSIESLSPTPGRAADDGRIAMGGVVPAGQVFDSLMAAFVQRDNLRYRRTIERIYLRAIGRARREVLIACAYFLPGRRFGRALCAAARRGVRVRLLLQGRVEYRLPYFGSLLRAGVEIIEYRPSFLHAKVAIADDWATVGSANLDPFSLLLAREANVVVHSREFAQALRMRLESAIATGGRPVELVEIERQPLLKRLLTRVAWWFMRIGVALSGSGLRY